MEESLTPLQHIANIREEHRMLWTTVPKMATQLSNAVKLLARNLYTDHMRVFYELLQNCGDAVAKRVHDHGTEGRASVYLAIVTEDPLALSEDGAILLFCDEDGFTHEDIEALCSVATGTKGREHAVADGVSIRLQTGEKGIGFKAVSMVCRRPHIFSGGYSFCLSATPAPEELPMLTPQWVSPDRGDVCRASLAKALGIDASRLVGGTLIALPLARSFDWKEFWSTLPSQLLLYLDNIASLTASISEGGQTTRKVYEKTVDSTTASSAECTIEEVTLSKSVSSVPGCLVERENWLVVRRRFTCPPDCVRDSRSDINAAWISCAVPLSERWSRWVKSSGVLYASLPTGIKSGLPFLVNSDFALSSSREAVESADKSPWNGWLFSKVPEVFEVMFDELFRRSTASEDGWDLTALVHTLNCMPVPGSTTPCLCDAAKECVRRVCARAVIPVLGSKSFVRSCEAVAEPETVVRLFADFHPRCASLDVVSALNADVRELLGLGRWGRAEWLAVLEHEEEFGKRSMDWICEFVRALARQTVLQSRDLELPCLMPVQHGDGFKLFPVATYLPLPDRRLGRFVAPPVAPPVASEFLASFVAFVPDKVLEVIHSLSASELERLHSFGLKPFKRSEYAVQLAERLLRREFSPGESVRFTSFLLTEASYQHEWRPDTAQLIRLLRHASFPFYNAYGQKVEGSALRPISDKDGSFHGLYGVKGFGTSCATQALHPEYFRNAQFELSLSSCTQIFGNVFQSEGVPTVPRPLPSEFCQWICNGPVKTRIDQVCGLLRWLNYRCNQGNFLVCCAALKTLEWVPVAQNGSVTFVVPSSAFILTSDGRTGLGPAVSKLYEVVVPVRKFTETLSALGVSCVTDRMHELVNLARYCGDVVCNWGTDSDVKTLIKAILTYIGENASQLQRVYPGRLRDLKAIGFVPFLHDGSWQVLQPGHIERVVAVRDREQTDAAKIMEKAGGCGLLFLRSESVPAQAWGVLPLLGVSETFTFDAWLRVYAAYIRDVGANAETMDVRKLCSICPTQWDMKQALQRQVPRCIWTGRMWVRPDEVQWISEAAMPLPRDVYRSLFPANLYGTYTAPVVDARGKPLRAQPSTAPIVAFFKGLLPEDCFEEKAIQTEHRVQFLLAVSKRGLPPGAPERAQYTTGIDEAYTILDKQADKKVLRAMTHLTTTGTFEPIDRLVQRDAKCPITDDVAAAAKLYFPRFEKCPGIMRALDIPPISKYLTGWGLTLSPFVVEEMTDVTDEYLPLTMRSCLTDALRYLAKKFDSKWDESPYEVQVWLDCLGSPAMKVREVDTLQQLAVLRDSDFCTPAARSVYWVGRDAAEVFEVNADSRKMPTGCKAPCGILLTRSTLTKNKRGLIARIIAENIRFPKHDALHRLLGLKNLSRGTFQDVVDEEFADLKAFDDCMVQEAGRMTSPLKPAIRVRLPVGGAVTPRARAAVDDDSGMPFEEMMRIVKVNPGFGRITEHRLVSRTLDADDPTGDEIDGPPGMRFVMETKECSASESREVDGDGVASERRRAGVQRLMASQGGRQRESYDETPARRGGSASFEEAIGRAGEKAVYDHLVEEYGEEAVVWPGKECRSYASYDIKYVVDGEDHFVEVKTSIGDDKFFMSGAEAAAARQFGGRYALYFVRAAFRPDDGTFSIVSMDVFHDPLASMASGGIALVGKAQFRVSSIPG